MGIFSNDNEPLKPKKKAVKIKPIKKLKPIKEETIEEVKKPVELEIINKFDEEPKEEIVEQIEDNTENQAVEEITQNTENEVIVEIAKKVKFEEITINDEIDKTEEIVENDEIQETTEIQESDKNEELTEEPKNDVNPDEKIDIIADENLKSEKKSKTKKAKKKDDDNMDSFKVNSLKEADNYMEKSLNFSTEEWEKEKKELWSSLNTVLYDDMLTPNELTGLLKGMVELKKTLNERLEDASAQHKYLFKKIESIKAFNSKGSNTSERNLNALKAVKFYKVNETDDKYIDLEEYEIAISNKISAYKSMLNVIEFNQKIFINACSLLKNMIATEE